MYRIFKISFSLKNTYRLNGILYAFRQIPVLKRLLPADIYSIKAFKIIAGILAALRELASVFAGKLIYLAAAVYGASALYEKLPQGRAFLHILLFLTVIGCFLNTQLFNPTRDKYYAIFLMRMDARGYTLVNYMYSIIKVIAGFMPFTILFATMAELPVWLGVILPFCIAGMKLFAAAVALWNYDKDDGSYNENKLNKYAWLAVALLLGAAYALPAFNLVMGEYAYAAVFMLCLPLGAVGLWRVLTFGRYREINQELFSDITNQMDSTVAKALKNQTKKSISADASLTSNRRGFEYLNELFIKRHSKILWSSSKKISYICLFIIAGIQLLMYLVPETRQSINETIVDRLPYFVFIMYAINRGTNFTQALFMNCDHSLLTYSFFKRRDCILKLFQIRLREIIKINAVPALVIGGGLAITLFTSGKTDNPLNYAILIVSVLFMSVFFSIHYLTNYYLLQPYNAATEVKSGTYRIVLAATYLLCFLLMKQSLPLLTFGIITIAFCVLYSIIASFFGLSPGAGNLQA